MAGLTERQGGVGQVASFEASYQGSPPPWDIGRPQPEFQALADAGLIRGRVLDVGCGTGEHALLGAWLGLDAVGVDTAPTAIGRARQKAAERGLRAEFVVADALDLAALGGGFDTVLDCGLLHVLTDQDRARYVRSLAAVLAPGGRYYLLGFSDQAPGEGGPRRLTRDEIAAAFETGWRLVELRRGLITTNQPGGTVPAWFGCLERSAA
jgi:SAM-dependent methyltransferase